MPNWGDTSAPAINISGKWLREVGFDTGRGITIKIAETAWRLFLIMTMCMRYTNNLKN
ncbi:SymE family type I addiction module toxin [Yokenella regensburgei]|uniref:SymE family type I addiction module toxin n=1 Tax=Yokenella regensburgei TaxID=158877 RepID=UPI001FD77365|nr:SymE family type I addiction module toxin [Yokenella regensburgei]